MATILIILAVVALLSLFAAFWIKALREKREMERHSITPEALHALFDASQDVLLYDVRLPLDFLAGSEIIPGATRITPREIQENPALIPRDREAVVYCTCPSDKTSMMISRKARALNFTRVKFLKGGLEAWKQKGYPVEPYRESFHLDTAT